MKRIVLLNALMILIFSSAFAQNYEGFQAWERGDIMSAKNSFESLYNSKKTRVVGAYGLGLVYSDERFPEYDMKRAFDYVNEARDIHKELKDSQKAELSKNKFKYSLMKSLRDQILTSAILEAKSKNTEEDLNYVIQNFKLPSESKKEVYLLRNAAALNTARLLNSYADYAKIYENYERRDFTRYSPEVAHEVDLRLFEAYVAENGYRPDEFKDAHPKSPFVSGINAVGKFREASKTGKPQALEAFAKEYSSNALAPLALKKAQILRDGNKPASINAGKPKQKSWDELLAWIKPQLQAGLWDEAARKMSKFEQDFTNYPAYLELYEILTRPSDMVNRRPVSVVNSSADEHMLCLTADDRTLYFAGDGRADGVGSDDIFMSKFVNGKWSKPKVLKDISTNYGEVPLSVSADGKRLILYQPIYDEKTDETKGGIAYSDKTSRGWSEPKPFPHPLNTNYWQADAQMTADGQGMILTVLRRKEDKQTDIYYVPKTGNRWGSLVSLGANVNTSGNERTPYLHPDMRTLYFSSDGRGGLGGMDVFMTTREGDSWTSWTRPVNLGKDINTAGTDWGYKITADGKRAFFASGNPRQDLYEIDLPERYRPSELDPVAAIDADGNGKIDTETNDIAKLEAEKAAKEKEEAEKLAAEKAAKEKEDAEKLAAEKAEKEKEDAEKLAAEKAAKETVEVVAVPEVLEVADVEEAIEKGQTYAFADLLFDYNSERINPDFHFNLDQIAIALNESGTSITVAGHTDSVGSRGYNQALSQRRAESVKSYLVSKGIQSTKIQAIGYGESKPIADNETNEGQAKNRRVEIVFER